MANLAGGLQLAEKAVLSRMSVKIKNVFLSPGDLTISALMYEESKTPIARLYTHNLSDGTTIGF